jgi:hypothetical protein
VHGFSEKVSFLIHISNQSFHSKIMKFFIVFVCLVRDSLADQPKEKRSLHGGLYGSGAGLALPSTLGYNSLGLAASALPAASFVPQQSPPVSSHTHSHSSSTIDRPVPVHVPQ